MSKKFDALMYVSFGGPEGKEDVLPFLNNVLRGKPVSEERKLEVAEHYYKFNGVSPINEQNKSIIECIELELKARSIDLPVYFGNRNWKPFIKDGFEKAYQNNHSNILCFFTSSYSSYSGCRQYKENIEQSIDDLNLKDKLSWGLIRKFYNHPKYVATHVQRIKEAEKDTCLNVDSATKVLFTAHSIPKIMAEACDYEKQLLETCRLTAESLNIEHWDLVYQSESGNGRIPWLKPDVCDAVKNIDLEKFEKVCVYPIGFISDHMEVMYDIDIEAKQAADAIGLQFIRPKCPGHHPLFISMIVDLIEERLDESKTRAHIGEYPARDDECPVGCCDWKKNLKRPVK